MSRSCKPESSAVNVVLKDVRANCFCASLSPGQTIATCQRNIVGRNMLRAFVRPVAPCCDMLGVVGSNLTIFKLEPTTPNMSQHVTTGWPNARNILRPTMLRYVALTCCDRLAGALLCAKCTHHFIHGARAK